jgi:hypothetical protein
VVPSEFEGEEYIKQERVTQHELAWFPVPVRQYCQGMSPCCDYAGRREAVDQAYLVTSSLFGLTILIQLEVWLASQSGQEKFTAR